MDGRMTRILKQPFYLVLCAVSVFVVSFIVYSPQLPLNVSLTLGQPSPMTIRSPQYIEFQTDQDIQRTESLITQRKQLVEPVIIIRRSIEKDIIEQIIGIFNQLRTPINDERPPSNLSFFTPEELTAIQDKSLNTLIEMEALCIQTTKHLLQNGIQIVNHALIELQIRDYLGAKSAHVPTITKIVRQTIQPNAFIDQNQTNEKVIKEAASIQPFKTFFKTGDIIVSNQEIITNTHLTALKKLHIYGSSINHKNFISILIYTIFLYALFERFLCFFYPKIYKKPSTYQITFLLIFLTLVSARLILALDSTQYIQQFEYIIPVPFLIVLICLILTPNIAMITGTITAILIAVMSNNDMQLFLYLFSLTCTSVFTCQKILKRSDLVKAGNIIGSVGVVIVVSFGIMNDISNPLWFLYHGILAFSNGLLCAMVSLAVLPYLEGMFKFTTSLGLLETANLNHPLLKKLMLNAPGTYQHSLMVANLCEAAAERIHADVILARIGAYFHDIGKMKRPSFFSENQFGIKNPHENLSPRMSKMIIAAHTKDGVELAEKYKLPPVIQDFILQHHGTSLVSFFYSIAKKDMSFSDEASTEDAFRYLGPKPQFKESGILLLADAVEAAIRSMDKPSIVKIETVIGRIFYAKINDDQLNESGLSFNDIVTIKRTFISLFKSIYHSRLDYEEALSKIIPLQKNTPT